jgi:hypothetical protein
MRYQSERRTMTAKPIAPIAAIIARAEAFMHTGAISAFQCGT